MKIKLTIEQKLPELPEHIVFLRQARMLKGKTQRDIAKYIGVTSMALSHYEHGIREPRFSTLEKWFDYFGLRITVEEKPINP